MAKLLMFGAESRFHNIASRKGPAYVPPMQVHRTRKQSVNAGPGRPSLDKRERVSSTPCIPVPGPRAVAGSFTDVSAISASGTFIRGPQKNNASKKVALGCIFLLTCL